MNTPPSPAREAAAEKPPQGLSDLPAALARRGGLSKDDLRRVALVQDQLGLGFIEAAMRLGLIAQADLDAVLSGNPVERAQPTSAVRPATALTSAQDPFDSFAENIRALRTELLVRAPTGEANVLVVMSAASGDGRSRLAAELAVSFAQLGQSTLLVDSDLRKAGQHHLFGANNHEGLAQALAQGRAPTLQPAIGLPSLSLLTAGSKAATPLELLSDPILGELLLGWKRRHRHIILDTPPTSLYSDGLAVATYAGRVLVVSRKHQSRMAPMRDMIQRLGSARATVVGAVLNNF